MQASPNIQFNNNINNNNNLIINKNTFVAIETGSVVGSGNKSNSNNILVHHNKSSGSCNTMTTASVPSPSVNYITPTINSSDDKNEVNGNQHQQIVLIANEQLEASDSEQQNVKTEDAEHRKISNGGDEELTPLHWLHDKNLLKGINLSCPKVQSPSTEVNQQQTRNGVTRTSSNDDSGTSDDNCTSLNDKQQQQQQPQLHQQLQSINPPPSPKPINYTTSDSVNNKLLINSSSPSAQPQQFGNSINATVIVSTSNLIENGSGNLSPNKQQPSPNGAHEHHTNNTTATNSAINLSSEETINKIIKSPQKPHQHFHKKYLREQLQQQDEAEKMHYDHHNGNTFGHMHHQHQQQTDQISNIQNSHMNSYIITKAEPESRYIYSDDREFLVNFNNNHIIQSNYEKSHEFDLTQKVIDYATPSKNSSSYSSGSSITSSTSSSPSPKQKQHPNNIPYDPHVHTASKPPYSFSSLIFMAIEDSPQKALPVKEIYAWIIQHFPYFKTAPTGWKNSVRHNLSLNKCFQKVEKAANLGKGSLWMVEPQYRPNLIQALTRSPFHPCSTWEKHAKNLVKAPNESPKQSNGSARLPNPEHFPFLARKLASMDGYDDEGQSRASTPCYELPQNYTTNGMVIYQNNNNAIVINGNVQSASASTEAAGRELNAETLDDVNAATAMLALKHGPKVFTEGIAFTHPPIITTSPSEDHTYSAFTGGGKNGTDNNSNGTSSDAAYESSEENHNVVYHFSQPLNDAEMEEQRRQAEGVDALLNLAGYNTNTTLLLKRPASTEEPKQFEKKQYFYTTEIGPAAQYQLTSDRYYDDEPPSKKPKSRILRNKLKKKTWYR